MKRFLIQAILLLLVFTSAKASEDEIMQAMRDEIKRSVENLEMDKLENPYFIEYKYTIKGIHNISGEYGSVTTSSFNRSATLDVKVRVGNYKFDNTNFSGSGGFISARCASFRLRSGSRCTLLTVYLLCKFL